MIADERGIALAMILVLSGITLGIMAGLVYMITSGTITSGIHTRYKTAYEASLGGIDVMQEVIGFRGVESSINRICDPVDPEIPNCDYTTPASCVPSNAGDCPTLDGFDPDLTRLETKLKLPTDCWSSCDSSLIIRPEDDTTYDISFTLGEAPRVYNVYAKVIDATEGNTGDPSDVVEPCGVEEACNDTQVPQLVFLYTLEVLVQGATNPLERAKTSALFAY